MIYRLSGLDIRTNEVKLHGILAECLPVEGIKLFRDIVIAELGIKKISCGNQGPHAGIAGIFRKFHIVEDRAPRLPRLVIASECRAG